MDQTETTHQELTGENLRCVAAVRKELPLQQAAQRFQEAELR